MSSIDSILKFGENHEISEAGLLKEVLSLTNFTREEIASIISIFSDSQKTHDLFKLILSDTNTNKFLMSNIGLEDDKINLLSNFFIKQYSDKYVFLNELKNLLKTLYPCFDITFCDLQNDETSTNSNNYIPRINISSNFGTLGIDIGISDLFSGIDGNLLEMEFLKLKKLFDKYGLNTKIAQILNSIETQFKDGLTGVYNKEYLLNLTNSTDYSVIFLDLNNLKSVNDTYGHYIGDLCIVNFGNIIKNSIREEDKVVRYGGDEFIILTKINSKEEIENMICRVNQNLANFRFQNVENYDLRALELSTSSGYALCDNKTPVSELLTISDEEMYKNKIICKCNKKNVD